MRFGGFRFPFKANLHRVTATPQAGFGGKPGAVRGGFALKPGAVRAVEIIGGGGGDHAHGGNRGGKRGKRGEANAKRVGEGIGHGGKRCGVAVLGGKAGGADGGNGGAQVSKGGICLFLGGFKVGGFGAR